MASCTCTESSAPSSSTTLGASNTVSAASTGSAAKYAALPIELPEARFTELQTLVKSHRLLRAPVFTIPVVPSAAQSPRATIVFGAIPTRPIYAFTTPVLIVLGDGDHEVAKVELLRVAKGDLEAVEAFELRQPTARTNTQVTRNPELLLIATFKGKEPARRFRRASHFIWSTKGRLVTSLASYALRNERSIATIADLRQRVDEIEREGVCPPLDQAMERVTIAQSLECMLRSNRRRFVESFAYPTTVLLRSGIVRSLKTPEELLTRYDDIIHPGVMAGVRQVAADPEAIYRWPAYSNFRLGYAGLQVQEKIGIIVNGVPARPQIAGLFNDDPATHAAMNKQLQGENRWLWQASAYEVVCRSDRATHVFFDANPYRLATWDDTKPSFRSRSPRRVLFGVLASAGTAGNRFYEFVAPEGRSVKFEHITNWGPEPAHEYSVVNPDGREPCLNHEHYHSD